MNDDPVPSLFVFLLGYGGFAVVSLLLLLAIAALAVLWANGIADEPPATAAERRFWPGDVVEDDGSYDD